MYFKSLELENFRNYKNLSLDFDPHLNIIIGENAQGKTNIIEALFITGLGKSFRTNKDSEMINLDSEFSRVKCTVIDENKNTDLEVIYQKEGKILKVDGIKLQRTIDLLENVYIVVFSPEDLRIVKDGPDNRRKFIDRELCQIKPVYYSDLGNYKKVIKQRNFLLKEKNNDKELFEVFNESLSDYGIRIIKERYKFIKRISEISSKIHFDISGGKEKLEVSYETVFKEDCTKSDYKKILNKHFEEDLFKGYTSMGPHKDDLCIKIDGKDIRSFGSQGQQRTAALSLKLAELLLINQETGKNAVLLLDDVLSELDDKRQTYLINSMNDYQVFITATDIENNIKSKLPTGKWFYVDNANVDLYNV